MFIKVNGCVTDEDYQGKRYFTVSDSFHQDNWVCVGDKCYIGNWFVSAISVT